MSDITVEITRTEIEISLQTPVIEIEFPVSLQGVGVPAGGDVGDVLTKTGSGDYVTGWEAPGAGANLEVYPAGENLSSGRVVIIDAGEAFYFQPGTTAHGGRAYGITKTSATTGNNVIIQRDGTVTDAAFSGFSDEALYVGTDGEIQTTWPVTGLLQKAGIAAGSNKVRIDFSIQIQQI